MSRVNYAHENSLAEGAITLKLMHEMMHEVQEKILEVAKESPELQERLENRNPTNFFPAFVADAFSPEEEQAILQWLGVSEE